jgi:integrase
MYVMGKVGAAEAQKAFHRFCLELHNHTALPIIPTGESCSVTELIAGFLDFSLATHNKPNYTHYRILLGDFLDPLYGDKPVNDFKTFDLHNLRTALIKSERFCRKQINDYIRRINTVFTWGVEMCKVDAPVALALKSVKILKEGHPGTHDNPERKHVPDEVIRKTLSHLSPTLRAMVKLQRSTGLRGGEICKMKIGDITGNWEYWFTHKTIEKTKHKRLIIFNPVEQAFIKPYLENRKAEEFVFSPQIAVRETGKTPSHRVGIRYDKDSYRTAVERAIERANRSLPAEQQIARWTPHQLRHAALSAIELEKGILVAQEAGGHATPSTTAIYVHRELEKQHRLAEERKSPFEPDN